MRARKITYIIAAVIAALIITSIIGGGATVARAAATTSATEAFEARNILDDLEGATIDGDKIDLSLYDFDEHKNVQLISFVEFCYSFRSDKRSDYGLYVYVYNPRGYDWTRNEELNKIQLRTGGNGGAHFEKYPLKYLNRSEKVGCEGLFYKFKVALSDKERSNVIASLNSGARVYEVGEIELCHNGFNAVAYDVSNTFKYTGYAVGYGSDSATSDSLSCTSSGLLTLTLDTHFADYRPEGSNGKNEYTQDLLHSVYFSIPNRILETYGGLSAVHATWLNARTAPIYITDSDDVYNGLYNAVWYSKGNPSATNYVMFTDYSCSVTGDVGIMQGDVHYSSGGIGFNTDNLYYEYDPGLFDDFGWAFRAKDGYKNIGALSYVFLADGNAASYGLKGDKILDYIQDYTQKVLNDDSLNIGSGSKPSFVAGKYSSALFESWDNEYTNVNVHADDKYTLTSEKLSQNFIEKLFGGSHVVSRENFRNIETIHAVKKEDFKSSSEETCKGLFIDKSYYDDFERYYRTATSRAETVFLFRYYQSDYESRKSEEFERFTPSVLIGSAKKDVLKVRNTFGYFAQMDVNLDFDIIDVTCSMGDVETVIACVMSPMDNVAGVTPPLAPVNSEKTGLPLWVVILIIIAAVILGVPLLVLLFILLAPLLKKLVILLFKGLWWLLTLPFRGLAALFRRNKTAKPKRSAKPRTTKTKKRSKPKSSKSKAGKKK